MNGMNIGSNNYNYNYNNTISLPMIQNGSGRSDTNSYLYNQSANNIHNQLQLQQQQQQQRRSETPNDQSSTFLMSEIKSLKQLIKATYESQTEMQGKIIEYNRIISQQENIIRLNNIKLSEHDNKLTDILLSFDNYLKLHDKSTKIVNEVQRRLDNTVSISDYSEFKSNYYSTKAIIDNQIASLYHTNEETQMKLIETTKENKTLQEYIIDKVKNVENNLTHTILDYQRSSLKIQETKDQNTNGQFNHIAGLIQITEANLKEEVKYRKSLLDNFKAEILGLFKQFDDKFVRVEKSQLETEKNLICLNKDYVGTFQELISNQKDKSDIELSSIRSLVEAGLAKNRLNFEENANSIKDKINKLSSGIEEQRTTYADLEAFVKDNVKSVNERMDNAHHTEIETNSKLETLHKALNTYIKENIDSIAKMQRDASKDSYDKFHQQIVELEQKTQSQIDYNTKGLSDLNEKTTQISNLLQLLSQADRKGKEGNDNDANSDHYYNKETALAIQLGDYQQKLIDFESRLKNEINTKIDAMSIKNKAETKAMLDSINDNITKIIEVLKTDLKNQSDGFQSTIEGQVQGLVVESESRLSDYFNKEIGIIQEAIETMMLKFGNKRND